jgi:hypothetical protein
MKKMMACTAMLALAFALICGTGTAEASVKVSSHVKQTEVELQRMLRVVQVQARERSGTIYDCPLIGVTCTLYVSWDWTVRINEQIQGAGPTAAATTAGKIVCSLAPQLKPFSAACGFVFALRMRNIQDELKHAVRSERCLEVKTSRPTPWPLPGHPPVHFISIGTWGNGELGRICK